ncbi:hypothetical protein [Micromonospora sp. NPDC047074]|uniref:hypothetical protein n=1 Tax=Micromonospora sp. NPDC047074 TaxID=3154339 RepID=UPI0033F6E6DF
MFTTRRAQARRRLSAAAVALLAAVTGAVVNATPAAASAVNNNANFLQVYVNNVENLLTAGESCAGDWQDLIYYMKRQDYSPDLFLVQQIDPQGELPALLNKMNTELAGVYKAVVAQTHPVFDDTPCGAEKGYQSNAIIYREGRFDLVGAKSAWQSYQPGSANCAGWAKLSRSINVAQRLRDQVSGKEIAVGSIHWPWHNLDVSPSSCPNQNAALTANKMAAFTGAQLYIAGGDFNQKDRSGGAWRGWYTTMHGTYGYTDAGFDDCEEPEQPGSIFDCTLSKHWTHGGGAARIDYLFAKRPTGQANMGYEHTVEYNEGDAADDHYTGTDNPDLHYSSHRAIRARIYY